MNNPLVIFDWLAFSIVATKFFEDFLFFIYFFSRFIGELFKLKMLTEKIMHECLKKLLKSDDDEDSLECLCQLLTTIGMDIDQNQSKVRIHSSVHVLNTKFF